MKIHEYQAKEILRKFGVVTPRGVACFSVDEAVAAAAQLQGVDVASPRRAWQSAFRLGWIDDDRLWLDMLEDRNRASHSYREATADRIRDRLPAYATALRALLLVLGQQP